MRKFASKLLNITLSAVLVCGLLPVASYAETESSTLETQSTLEPEGSVIMPDLTYSGTCGTCQWQIDSAGKLTISPMDNQESGTLEDWGTDCPSWPNDMVRSVEFTGHVIAQTCNAMFYDAEKLTSVDLTNLDTSGVTSFANMFCYCKSLTSVNLSTLDFSNATDTSTMFADCTNLNGLVLPNISASNITSMSYMFDYCSSLGSDLIMRCVNTMLTGNNGKCTDWTRGLFRGCQDYVIDCSKLNSGQTGYEYLDTSNATNMTSMFEGCSNVTSLDLTSFNTLKVTTMREMFENCSSVTVIDLSSFDTRNVTDMYYMFKECPALKTIYAAGGFSTELVADDEVIFYHCDSLVGGNGTSADYRYLKRYAHVDENLHPGLFTLKEGTAIGWQQCGTCEWLIDSTGKLTVRPTNGESGTLRDWGTYSNGCPWNNNDSITSVVIEEGVSAPSCMSMFRSCSNITSMDLSGLDTSNVTRMDYMFYGCSSLTSLDLSGLDTSNVTIMYGMFQGCSNLTSLDLSSFDTSSLKDMTGMFYDCTSLVSLNLSNLDSSKLEYMANMFYNCASLSADTRMRYMNTLLSKIKNAKQCTDWAKGLFAGCYDEEIDCLKFNSGLKGYEYLNTEYLTDMQVMFLYCPNVTTLDLSSFNTSSATDMYAMFNNSLNLKTIYVGDGFTTANVTSSDYMFGGCTSLVGGNGTAYSSSYMGIERACVDSSSNAGYFSTKSVTDGWTQCGSCEWMVDGNGKLTIRPLGDGEYGILENWFSTLPDWASNASITSVAIEGRVSAKTCYGMFYGCSNLTSVDLRNLDTSSAMNMSEMFMGCSSLTSLDVTSLDTSNATNMSSMFCECAGLSSLDVSGFNTSNVTNMSSMFGYCSGLTSLDVSSFDTAKVTNMSSMFSGCKNLETIYVTSGFSTEKVTSSYGMFNGCSSLVGGSGTTYYYSHQDASYAHVDGGTANPGYFTLKCDHDSSAVEAIPAAVATCTQAGHKAYWHCTVCDGYFSDEALTLRIADLNAWLAEGGAGYIAALGHSYGAPSFVFSNDAKSATATWTCLRCLDQQTAPCVVTSIVSKAATCTAAGETAYTARAEKDGFASGEATMCAMDIPAKGHAYGSPSIGFSSDGKTATATWVCANDSRHLVKESCTCTSVVTKAPTLTEMGETTYTATFAGNAAEGRAARTASVTVADIDPLGVHEFDASGYCARCGSRFTVSAYVPSRGYKVTFVPGDAISGGCATYNGDAMTWMKGDECWAVVVSSLPSNWNTVFGVDAEAAFEEVDNTGSAEQRVSVRGDLNDNGTLNIVDAQIAYDLATGVYAVGGNSTLLLRADVKNDSILDSADARFIQTSVSGK